MVSDRVDTAISLPTAYPAWYAGNSLSKTVKRPKIYVFKWMNVNFDSENAAASR
jgi:hypothetical protein